MSSAGGQQEEGAGGEGEGGIVASQAGPKQSANIFKRGRAVKRIS